LATFLICKNSFFFLSIIVNTPMLTATHIDENALINKINALFEYRLFPLLFSFKRNNVSVETFILNQQLVELQKRIYYLDAHLEANLNPDGEVLNYLWQQIYIQCGQLGIKNEDLKSYTNHIHKYQKHELELRENKLPLRFKMEYFYFYKSCDVKLIRRIIYEQLRLSRDLCALSYWRYYDLITEVNDDVEDVFEDLQFFNGNRFLISLLQKGSDFTYRTFEDFIRYIDACNKNLIDDHTFYDLRLLIQNETSKRIEETLELLNRRKKEITEAVLSESVLFSHQLLNNI
jgi:hypothetical protein